MSNHELILKDQVNKSYPVKVKLAYERPVIDGKLDDECWQDAEKISGLLILGKELNKAKEQTIARLAYDKENLYLGVICFESKMDMIKDAHKERDGHVFQDDCIEIFLDWEKKGEKYCHIVVNSIGSIYDSWHYTIGWYEESGKD